MIIGKPSNEALMDMQHKSGEDPSRRWAVYQNQDLGSPSLGALQFLAIGPNCTYQEPPKRLPDTPRSINWRYWFVGWVDLHTGEIEEETL